MKRERERPNEQCPNCQRVGFLVVKEITVTGQASWLHCRKCKHEWSTP